MVGLTVGLQEHHLIGGGCDLEPLLNLDLEVFGFALLLWLELDESPLHQSHDSDDAQFQLSDCILRFCFFFSS